MKLTIAVDGGDIHNLDVHESLDIQSFKALLGAELNQPEERILIIYGDQELAEPTKTLADYTIKEGDILLVSVLNLDSSQQLPSGSGNNQSSSIVDTELFRQKILNNPQLKRKIEETAPELAAAVSNDPVKFSRLFREMEEKQAELSREREKELALLDSDPFNIEAQKKIEEIIRNQNVMKNMHEAMEFNPESFGQVHMLYINMELNGHPVKAFVDSGAQSTIISPRCAEACGIMRLIDSRFQGVARGVGTAKILGRIHNAPIKIGNQFYPCSFIVLEGKDVDLLFGLDMLKRYQACIDLKSNSLVISDDHIPFLPEHELPKNAFSGSEQSPPQSSASEIPLNTTKINPSSAPSLPSRAPAQFSEESIKTLMDLGGISREYAIALLTQAKGNVELAASSLFG